LSLHIDPDILQANYLRIFCILLVLGKGYLIKRFSECQLEDDLLPFHNFSLHPQLFSGGDFNFWDSVYKLQ
jgi:hypothetical protein